VNGCDPEIVIFWIRLSWSQSLVMARKWDWEFLLAVYINFDHCSLLDTASVIVYMILAAKRWDLRYGPKSEHKKALWKMESYSLICSVTLSPHLSRQLRPDNLFYMWLGFILQKKDGNLATLGTISHFLISLVLRQLQRIIYKDELIILTENYFSFGGILLNCYCKDCCPFHINPLTPNDL
jgi:hypothetical protein